MTDELKPLAETTRRMYSTIWTDFDEWAHYHKYKLPLDYSKIAAYLRPISRKTPGMIAVNVSAIAYLYRKNNWPIDVKHPTLQKIKHQAKYNTR